MIIYILVYYGVIKDIFGSESSDDPKLLSSKLQNFLICIEMFLAALAHHYSFSHKPYVRNFPVSNLECGSINGNSNGSWYSALLNMLDISDVHQDVSEHLGVVGSSLSRRLRGRTTYQMPREGSAMCDAGSEREYLVQPASGPSSPRAGHSYQSGLSYTGSQIHSNLPKLAQNRYGTLDSGISIVKPKLDKLVETPHEGAPKVVNIFSQFQNSKALNLMLARTPSFDNLTSSSSSNQKALATTGSGHTSGATTNNTTTSTTSDANLRKSDSNNSDWLSTPDEDLGIDVKGLSNDRINYHPDRRA